MIDYFALALTHVLIVIALLRILVRPDLDREDLVTADEVAEPKTGRRDALHARRNRKSTDDA